MNPGSVLPVMPGATPVPGLEPSWRWSPNPMFTFTAVLSTDGEHNLRVNVRGPYDEGLVTALLAHARAHDGEFVGRGRPLAGIEGFRHPGSAFDAVGVATAEVHGYHATEHPGLSAVTHAVSPPTPVRSPAGRTVGARFSARRPGIPSGSDRSPTSRPRCAACGTGPVRVYEVALSWTGRQQSGNGLLINDRHHEFKSGVAASKGVGVL